MKLNLLHMWTVFTSMLSQESNIQNTYPSHFKPSQSRLLHAWQTKTVWGDGGDPFKWQKHRASTAKIKNVDNGEIIVVTYNCWQAGDNVKNRCDYLIELLLRSPAHVVCLQEMTAVVLRKLLNNSGLIKKFIFSDITGASLAPTQRSGQITLYRRDYIRVYRIFNVPSQYPHHLVQCSVIAWASEQLERHALIINVQSSNDARTTGRSQFQSLDYIIQQVKWHKGIIATGDFNLDDTEEDDIPTEFEWKDAAMICKAERISTSTALDDRVSYRPDRILFRNWDNQFEAIWYEIFGNDPICDENQIISTFGSSHLGVSANFKFSS